MVDIAGGKRTRVLVLGASGMLGWTVTRSLLAADDIEVHASVRETTSLPHALRSELGAGLHQGDLVDDEVRRAILAEARPDIVLNAVGVIKQDHGIGDRAATLRINSLLPHLLADECDAINARLVQVSTDCVFSGARGSYTEDDRPDPVDFYGHSKLLGELESRHLTVRTSIIGPELRRGASLLEWFLSQDHQQVNGFTRAIYSGVSTAEFARFLRDVVIPRPDLSGLIHLASSPISKYELLELIAEAYDWRGSITPEETFACDRSLRAERLRRLTGYEPPAWPDMVAEMAEDHRATGLVKGRAT